MPNKSTQLLKDAILKAAAMADPTPEDGAEGSLVGYLKWAARETPGPFLGLLGKVLPMQLAGEDGEPISFTIHYEAKKGIDYRETLTP